MNPRLILILVILLTFYRLYLSIERYILNDFTFSNENSLFSKEMSQDDQYILCRSTSTSDNLRDLNIPYINFSRDFPSPYYDSL